MKNLFQAESANEIISRINNLTHETQRQWGTMDVAQMMAHCSAAFEIALGDRKRPRAFIGYLFGGLVKKQYVYSTNYKHNQPTDPTFKIADQRDFETEKSRLIGFINRMQQGQESVVTSNTHPFFGKMTPVEWAQLKYNHINHHLTQFGV